jgi:Na+/H+ antiporter NhaA
MSAQPGSDGAAPSTATPVTGRTAWARNLAAPVRDFLTTETGGAVVLLCAAVAALLWANSPWSDSYESLWTTKLSIRIGDGGISEDLRHWVNEGLMTFFFLVVGLEAKRELDVGQLRERRRATIPALAAVGGMAVPVLIYLAFNAGGSGAHGWGAAMSTDTAFALGVLALVGPRFPERLRSFVLTVVVVDDVVALLVIATVYSEDVEAAPLFAAALLFVLVLIALRLNVRYGLLYLVLGIAAWGALYESGVDPLVIGLAMGLLTYAGVAGRDELERATDLFRSFREQPTSELAREAQVGLNAAVSPNARLQNLYHPWTSYVVVPLFALANAGIVVNGDALSRAVRSPVTIGIVVGYVVGKPLGVFVVCWLGTALTRGRLRPPVGWAAVLGAGTSAGIGFTVSLLIASLAFEGSRLDDATLGILAAALLSALLTWLVFRVTAMLPAPLQVRATAGLAEPIIDLTEPVDPERDHVRGPSDARVTLVEYGDFECPYCGQAEPAVRALLAGHGDVRYVWRHLPLPDVHPNAIKAALAAEAAAKQGAFWPMHDLLLSHQDALTVRDLVSHADQLGLDVPRFTADLKRHTGEKRIAEDVEHAAASGVVGTPTFFVNGRRHHGAYDLATLTEAVKAAKARTLLAQ